MKMFHKRSLWKRHWIGKWRKGIFAGIGSFVILLCSYTSPDVVYASEAEPVGTETQIIYKGPVYLSYKEIEDPKSILEQGKEIYRLVSTEVQEVPIEGILTYVSASVSYDLEGQQSPPETSVVTLYDERTQSEYKRELTCMGMEEKEVLWEKTFTFPITISGYDADSYQLGEIIIEKEDDLIQYEAELLEHMQLSAEDYHIETIEWLGESYEKEGTVMRDAVATGEKRIRRVEATYGDEIRTPETTGYQHVSVYEKLEESGKDNAENGNRITRAGREDEQEPIKQRHLLERMKKFLKEHLTVVTIGAGFILIAVCMLGMLIRLKREGEESNRKIKKKNKKEK